MDVLSDVVALARTGRPISARISWRSPWGRQFPSSPGSAIFQVVLRGSCWLIPSGDDPIPLSVGDVVFLPHGDSYGLTDAPERPLAASDCGPHEDPGLFTTATLGGAGAETVTLCCGYHLAPGRTHPTLTQLPKVIHLPTTLGRHPELRATLELLAGEIDNPRLGADTLVTSLLDMIHLYVLRAWYDEQAATVTKTGWAAALADPSISRALEVIHRTPAHHWTLESLASRAGLSRAGFARRFTNLVGRSPLAYVTWWRLTTAARMLRESDASVGEVASRSGYGSEFAFSSAFKREYGIAPGKYRRQTCEEAAARGTSTA